MYSPDYPSVSAWKDTGDSVHAEVFMFMFMVRWLFESYFSNCVCIASGTTDLGMVPHMYDMAPQTHGMPPPTCDVAPTYDVAPHTYDVAPQTYDVAPQTYEVAHTLLEAGESVEWQSCVQSYACVWMTVHWPDYHWLLAM